MLDRNVVVGQRIRALRMQRGLGQSQAAKMIGISQSHLSNIEGGRSHVTLEILTKILRQPAAVVLALAASQWLH